MTVTFLADRERAIPLMVASRRTAPRVVGRREVVWRVELSGEATVFLFVEAQ